MVIHQLHGCDSVYVQSVTIHERFQEQTVWKGEVEVFDLRNHADSNRCFAWSYNSDGGGEQIVTVLEKPPIVTAELAVRAAIVDQYRKK
jgi:hypothetical protein